MIKIPPSVFAGPKLQRPTLETIQSCNGAVFTHFDRAPFFGCQTSDALIFVDDLPHCRASRNACRLAVLFFAAVELWCLWYFLPNCAIFGRAAVPSEEQCSESALSVPCPSRLFFVFLALSNLAYARMVWGPGHYPGFISIEGSEVDPSFVPQNFARVCKYCRTKQPLRCRHVHECGRCVARFDHHCFWIGTSVGATNHRGFVIMVACLFLTLVMGTFHVWTSFVDEWRNDATFWSHIKVNLGFVGLGIVGGLMSVFLGGVLLSHVILISLNQTTYEFMRPEKLRYYDLDNLGERSSSFSRRWRRGSSPFDEGLVKNWCHFVSGSFCHSVNFSVAGFKKDYIV